MSNTLNTPVEALELAYPLRVCDTRCAAVRAAPGRFRGGDGVVRELEALAPMAYSLITERRRHPPPGAQGGARGARPQHARRRAAASQVERELATGQRLRIETPGGGGFGRTGMTSGAR